MNHRAVDHHLGLQHQLKVDALEKLTLRLPNHVQGPCTVQKLHRCALFVIDSFYRIVLYKVRKIVLNSH